MSDRKLKFGILGCAKIATGAVIPGIQASQVCDVVAIASRDETKAKTTAEKLGIALSYGAYEDLLTNDEIDAVYIPLPNHLHKEWAIRAAEAGKHVLCEKPIALNADEARQMVDAARKANVKLAEALMYRHHPRYDLMKQIVADGEIGEIRGIHGTFTFNNATDSTNVRYQRAMGGGSIYDVGCYPISAARMILDAEPEAVTVQAFFSPDHDEVDMMASGLVEFPKSVSLTFDCGMWADFRNTLEILGTTGRIEVPNAFVGNPNFFVISKGERREVEIPQLNQYTLQADCFARSVLHDEPLTFAETDAVNNMRVIDACLRSAREHVRVVL